MPEKLHWFSNDIDQSLKSKRKQINCRWKNICKTSWTHKKIRTLGDGNIRTAFDKKLRKITDSKIIPTNKGLDNGHAAGNGVISYAGSKQ